MSAKPDPFIGSKFVLYMHGLIYSILILVLHLEERSAVSCTAAAVDNTNYVDWSVTFQSPNKCMNIASRTSHVSMLDQARPHVSTCASTSNTVLGAVFFITYSWQNKSWSWTIALDTEHRTFIHPPTPKRQKSRFKSPRCKRLLTRAMGFARIQVPPSRPCADGIIVVFKQHAVSSQFVAYDRRSTPWKKRNLISVVAQEHVCAVAVTLCGAVATCFLSWEGVVLLCLHRSLHTSDNVTLSVWYY